mmetsp:Transcript_23885/g.74673  ORF Transcript_23885/g.74673 Transcript_23885/m.74673 type:complete len:312 (+) Transcript_23885:329-1264(+)
MRAGFSFPSRSPSRSPRRATPTGTEADDRSNRRKTQWKCDLSHSYYRHVRRFIITGHGTASTNYFGDSSPGPGNRISPYRLCSGVGPIEGEARAEPALPLVLPPRVHLPAVRRVVPPNPPVHLGYDVLPLGTLQYRPPGVGEESDVAVGVENVYPEAQEIADDLGNSAHQLEVRVGHVCHELLPRPRRRHHPRGERDDPPRRARGEGGEGPPIHSDDNEVPDPGRPEPVQPVGSVFEERAVRHSDNEPPLGPRGAQSHAGGVPGHAPALISGRRGLGERRGREGTGEGRAAGLCSLAGAPAALPVWACLLP